MVRTGHGLSPIKVFTYTYILKHCLFNFEYQCYSRKEGSMTVLCDNVQFNTLKLYLYFAQGNVIAAIMVLLECVPIVSTYIF